MLWRNPAAWFGLATLLIPIAIHLLARQRAESRVFPSLRFILPSRLAAVRRRAISDWPLLLVRLAILAVVVAALADPLWLSAARRAEWSTRVARAVVIDTSASNNAGTGAGTSTGSGATATTTTPTPPPPTTTAAPWREIVQRETSGAFQSTTLETMDLADGLHRAADWLSTAPPARREIVILSDFQLGALDPAMLRDVPSHIGLRFVRSATTPVTRDADGQPRTHRAADGFTAWTPHVTLNAHETAVGWRSTIDARVAIETTPTGFSVSPFKLLVDASDADRPLLAAATQAVLAQGVRVPATADADAKPITIVVARRGDGGGNTSANIAELPRDVARLSAPWMSDVLARIATDPQLVHAVSRSALNAPRVAVNDPHAPEIAAAHGAVSPSLGRPRGSTTPSRDGTHDRATGAPPAPPIAAGRDASGPSSPAPPDASAAAPRDEARGGAGGALPSPWIVVMRDAAGHPALLAASATARAELVLVSRAAAQDEATALLVRAALRAAAGTEPLSEAEVLTVADAMLAQWQRPASDPPASEWQRVDTHDRRWLWGAALVLIVVEHVVRRGRRSTDAHQDQTYEHAA